MAIGLTRVLSKMFRNTVNIIVLVSSFNLSLASLSSWTLQDWPCLLEDKNQDLPLQGVQFQLSFTLHFSFRTSGPLNKYQVSNLFTMFSPIRSLSFSDSDSSAVSQMRQGAGKGVFNYNWGCKHILAVKGQTIMLHFIEESWERIMVQGAKQTVNSSQYYCKYVVCICIGMCVKCIVCSTGGERGE